MCKNRGESILTSRKCLTAYQSRLAVHNHFFYWAMHFPSQPPSQKKRSRLFTFAVINELSKSRGLAETTSGSTASRVLLTVAQIG